MIESKRIDKEYRFLYKKFLKTEKERDFLLDENFALKIENEDQKLAEQNLKIEKNNLTEENKRLLKENEELHQKLRDKVDKKLNKSILDKLPFLKKR